MFADTALLRDVLAEPGPFASVYFDSSHDTEEAAREVDLRWRDVRERLAEQGAPEETLAALDRAIQDRSPAVGRAGRLLIAAGSRVLVDEYLPNPPAQPTVRLSALPYFLPLSESVAGVPHVVALVDKTGGDLHAEHADGSPAGDHRVEGRDHPVHKVRGGGWSHRNIHRHVEETVRQNLHEVARQTAELVRQVGARLVIVAGDVEARSQLWQALPASCTRIAVELDIARPTDRSTWSAFEGAVRTLVEQSWRAEHDAVLERLLGELNRPEGLAVDGLRPTTKALRDGNVDLLIVDPAQLGERTVWLGSDPRLVAVSQADLHTVGASGRIRSPADEALPAAAVATGAGLVATGADSDAPVRLGDGVGALLRHG